MRNVLGVLRYQRSAEEVEVDYTRFCKLTKPLLTMGVAVALWYLYTSFIAFFTIGLPYIVVLLIVGIRGRALVSALLCGRLSWAGMAIIGVAVGIGSVLNSLIIGLAFLNPPVFDLARVYNLNEGGLLEIYRSDVSAPFVEEMLFQVGLQTALQRFGPVVAVIGTTLIFWSLHFPYDSHLLVHVIYILPALLTFAVVRQITKSMGAAIIAHSVSNIIVSIVVYLP